MAAIAPPPIALHRTQVGPGPVCEHGISDPTAPRVAPEASPRAPPATAAAVDPPDSCAMAVAGDSA